MIHFGMIPPSGGREVTFYNLMGAVVLLRVAASTNNQINTDPRKPYVLFEAGYLRR
jgi:hypothetical protein